MKSQLTWQDVQKLERSFHQPTQPRHTWKTRLNDLWQTTLAHIAAADEPHVWQAQDKQGHKLWNAFDPKTGRSVKRLTTSEMQAWLEERHYQTL